MGNRDSLTKPESNTVEVKRIVTLKTWAACIPLKIRAVDECLSQQKNRVKADTDRCIFILTHTNTLSYSKHNYTWSKTAFLMACTL